MANSAAITLVKNNLWPAINGLLGLVLLGLLVALLGNSDTLANRAMEEGRRMVIDLRNMSVIGNPVALPKPEAATAKELPKELPPVAAEEPKPAEPAPPLNAAMPGNFVGEKLESQQPQPQQPPAEKMDYPEKVKQEPHTRHTATAAPATPVKVQELEAAPPGKPLASAPIAALEEEVSKDIKLPKIGADGARPWQAYGKPFEASSSEPLVTVIVAGLGMNNATQIAFKLQEDFTLSFSPYGREAAMWGAQARNSGHEVLLDLPMQTQDYPAIDPGPQGLLTTLKPKENLERLHWVMSRFPGYVGLTGSVGASVPTAIIQSSLSDIAARGLLMVEMPMTSDMGDSKKQMGLLSLTAHQILDAELDETHINAKLAELVKLAKKNGQAIGIAHPYPLTLQVLQQWQKTLAEQGVRLAPVSALAARVKE